MIEWLRWSMKRWGKEDIMESHSQEHQHWNVPVLLKMGIDLCLLQIWAQLSTNFLNLHFAFTFQDAEMPKVTSGGARKLARLLTTRDKFVCFDINSPVAIDCARSSLCMAHYLELKKFCYMLYATHRQCWNFTEILTWIY